MNSIYRVLLMGIALATRFCMYQGKTEAATWPVVVLAVLLIGWDAGAQDIHYVAHNGQTPAYPYASWATAASNIQDAVDAATDGDTVLVTNGLYDAGGAVSPYGHITNRVAAEAAITVQSVNGPAVTTIRGNMLDSPSAVRCVHLGNGAILAGFTLTNGSAWVSGVFEDIYGGGVYISSDGQISNCWVMGCYGSGIHCNNGGSVSDCLVQDNIGASGGGIDVLSSDTVETIINRCHILRNTSFSIGGGVALMGATIRDSLVCSNRAVSVTDSTGGGISASGGTIINCTIVWNESFYLGGGVADENTSELGDPITVANSIMYYNTAPAGSNFYAAANTNVTYSCTIPQLDGTGNITNAPMLVGLYNPHILSASPCRGAGSLDAIEPDETDIDGEQRDWGGAVDIGCDQFVATNITGALSMNIDAPFTNALLNTPLRFRSAIGGKADMLAWSVVIPGATNGFTNTPDWTYVWATAGTYAVTLSATNHDGSGAATVTVTIADSFTNYFASTGSHTAPFTNWTTAATNLQDTIDACYVGGGVVLVQTGTHTSASEISINRSVIIRGAGTETNTVIAGSGTNRCFMVSDPGAVIEHLAIRNGYANMGGGAYLSGGTMRNCHLIGNSATLLGGGAYLERNAVITNCQLTGNSAVKWGGGAFLEGTVRLSDCVIISNWSDAYGGGVQADFFAVIDNSYFAENISWGGGGLYLSMATARNCTLIKNVAEGVGGGVCADYGTSLNCIVYFNEAGFTAQGNYFDMHPSGGSLLSYCCTTPLPAGEGNIVADPLMTGINNPHILAASPCRTTGYTNFVEAGQVDIDGEARISGGHVDIGCDEYIVGAVTGAITAAIRGDTNTVYGIAEPMSADLSGKIVSFLWSIQREDGQFYYLTNQMDIAPVWTNAGDFQIILSASNESFSAAVTAIEHVIAGGFTNYVSLAGAHIPPFTNWATAATNIQPAVDACYEGGTVLVQTGCYAISSVLLLNRAVFVQSVSGPDLTIVDAGGNCRGATLSVDGAFLSGLTISNGFATGCGGVYMLGGTLSNCAIVSCVGTNVVGGVECHRSAVVRDSIIRGNYAFNNSGGILISGSGLVWNCSIENNTVVNDGAGIYFLFGGRALDCTLRNNAAVTHGGGLFFLEGGQAINCLISSNTADNGAGVCFDGGGSASNCVFQLNRGFDGGGAWFEEGGEMDNCLLLSNHADTTFGHGGGAVLYGGGLMRDCVISNSEAAFAAGVWFEGGGEFRRCRICNNHAYWGNPDLESAGVAGGFYMHEGGTLADSLVADNNAAQDAGAGVIEYSGILQSCSIVNNTASNHCGGVMIFDYANVVNTIIWSNLAVVSNNYYLDLDPYSPIAISNNCSDPLLPGTNNLAVNPQFANAAAGNWRLHWDSPCVDAGADLETSSAVDLDGNPRLAGAHEDLGCYELQRRDHLLAAGRIRRHEFTANWQAVSMATNYWLDVAGDNSFTIYVPGYQNRDIGLVTNLAITNLSATTPYYYRVRAESVYGVGVNSTISNVISATHSPASGQNAGFDWDGDGLADIIVYNPRTGQWIVLLSSMGYTSGISGFFGGPGFVPVCGDFNGDALTDPGVYAEASGLWQALIWNGIDFSFYEQVFGALGYKAAPGDYDGDEKTDLTIYNETTGLWLSWYSGEEQLVTGIWGGPGMKAASADFNGDGKSDPTVYNSANGIWYSLLSSESDVHQPVEFQFGGPGMTPAAADYDGDNKADPAVYIETNGCWHAFLSGDWSIQTTVLGGPGYKAVPADYNADGKADPCVYDTRTGEWIGYYSGPDGYTVGRALLGGAGYYPPSILNP